MPALSNPQIAYRLQGSSDSDWTLLTVADGSFPESFTVTGGAYEVKTMTWSESAQFSVTYSPSFLFAANEPGVWYDPSDMSTMFQDAAGTTPVTAVEQPVGLILDKSKGLTLGPELVVALASVSGAYTAPSIGFVERNGEIGTAMIAIGFAGVTYRVTFTVSGQTGDTNFIRTAGGTAFQFNGNGTYTFTLLSVSTGGISISPWAGTLGTATFSNISVRELPGNHATQPTATARPVLSARVNLLTKTEQFDDAAWPKENVTVVAGNVVAPDGTATAELIYPTTTGSNRRILRPTSLTTGVIYAQSVYVKAAGKRWVYFNGVDASSAVNNCWFDLENGVIGTKGSSVLSAGITAVGNGWYRIFATGAAAANTFFYLMTADNDNSLVSTASGTSGVFIWGASLVPANQAALPYQRVNTATDYDADPAKFPKRLNFDNLDDAHNIAFPSALGSNCTVARAIPGVGAQILTGQTIGTSFSNTITHAGMVIVDRALTVSESNNLTTYLNEKAGV